MLYTGHNSKAVNFAFYIDDFTGVISLLLLLHLCFHLPVSIRNFVPVGRWFCKTFSNGWNRQLRMKQGLHYTGAGSFGQHLERKLKDAWVCCLQAPLSLRMRCQVFLHAHKAWLKMVS